MANLKEIKSRISSVSSTMKITNAMKMISAAKLKKSQDRMNYIKPYSEGVSNLIRDLIPKKDKSQNKLISTQPAQPTQGKILIIPITSNRGYCGGFTSNVFKKAHELIKNNFKKNSIEIFCIGKKAQEIFIKTNHHVIDTEINILNNVTFLASKKISEKITAQFLNNKWSKVIVIYNKFKNAATQIISSEKLLPIDLNKENIENKNTSKDYIFEPDKTSIINTLLPKKINIQLFESILNSIASEHGARMTAMHKATDNAQELKQSLTLSYNRQRQAAITNEILEIVAGAEALKGS